ncbi:MAG: type 1 glutamine amidotransferase [Candidatus Omnitrophota bacterium]
MILIIKHIDIEGPGTLGDFLDQKNEPYQVLDLGAGDSLPNDFSCLRAVVVLGGPMNVDEEQIHPFLKPENDFIKGVLQRGIPYLGICLGSQLLAKAAGARVVKSPSKEIGWYHIKLTEDGQKDPLFKGFSESELIYQWHGDMFQIPLNGKLLATSVDCPHQALRVGSNAYGLQFHIEVTDKSIKEWCQEYAQNDLPGREEHVQAMIDGYWKNQKSFLIQANKLYVNFLDIINHPV